jgi:hypothetical protein
MARRKNDFRDASQIRISQAAIFAMCMSAIEVFPRETIGCVCSRGDMCASIAFPYQVARRNRRSVSSLSSCCFGKLLDGGSGGWLKLGDFHSHPFQYFEEIATLEPSEDDVRSIRVGQMEIIVRTRMTRGRRHRWRCRARGGRVEASQGRFRFLVRAFVRMPGRIEQGMPAYRTIDLVLTQ